MKNFKEAVEKARENSRHEADKLDDEIISNYSLNLLESTNVPKTDDSLKYDYSWDKNGYKFPKVKCKVVGMVLNGNILDDSVQIL